MLEKLICDIICCENNSFSDICMSVFSLDNENIACHDVKGAL